MVLIDLVYGDESEPESDDNNATTKRTLIRGSKRNQLETSEESNDEESDDDSKGGSQDRSDHDNLEIGNKGDDVGSQGGSSETETEKENGNVRGRSRSRSASGDTSVSRSRTRSGSASASANGTSKQDDSGKSKAENVTMEAGQRATQEDYDTEDEEDAKINELPDKYTPTGETDDEEYDENDNTSDSRYSEEEEDDYEDGDEDGDEDEEEDENVDENVDESNFSDHDRYDEDSDITETDTKVRRSQRIKNKEKSKSKESNEESNDENVVLNPKFPYKLEAKDILPKAKDVTMSTQKKNGISGVYRKEMFIDEKDAVQTINIRVKDVNLRLTKGALAHVMAYKLELCIARDISMYFGDGDIDINDFIQVIKFNRLFTEKYNGYGGQLGGANKIQSSSVTTGYKKLKLMSQKLAGVILGVYNSKKDIHAIRRLTRECLKLKSVYDLSFDDCLVRFEHFPWRLGAKYGMTNRLWCVFIALRWGFYLFFKSKMLDYNKCTLDLSKSITLKPSVKGLFEETVGFVDEDGQLCYICIHICNLWTHKCIYSHISCLCDT